MKDKQYKSVIVFPSFNEEKNLSSLLKELSVSLDSKTIIVIADDSGEKNRESLEATCKDALSSFPGKLDFNYSENKDGRGSAVRRSFLSVRKAYPSVFFFVEADSDGSHRVEDILSLVSSESEADLLIGSRYVKGSKIVGWPISRRVLSRFLNTVIPILLSVPAKDLTNGLRRYSSKAIDTVLQSPAKNSGFIYLSEVAEIISSNGLTIKEVPIRFENRVHGSSTVGRKELTDSLRGLVRLVLNK